ncbi:MAG: glycosyltransferase [Planctomycetota bacterium]
MTLVIPGRNCESTLRTCLESVARLLKTKELDEIIFVDDGSTDTTPEIASRYPVKVLTGEGRGPGAARNLGWQAAKSELIWCIDSDCVAKPDALQKLMPHMHDSSVAGVGGSYANLYPHSLLASVIHEEIVARHRRMKPDVNFLATFNVVYRRDVLDQLGGFDEFLKLAQDAELAYRISAAGHRLRFEIDSRVGHHHPQRWRRYLRTQCRQGYFRMRLYRSHPSMMRGDSYAGLVDYAQPPLACLCWAALAGAILWMPALAIAAIGSLLLLLLQWPMTRQCIGALGLRGTSFAVLGFVRAHVRAAGMVAGMIANAATPPSCWATTSVVDEASSPGASTSQSCGNLPDVASVSVIIPTRNRSQKIIKCLDSLREQSVSGFEVVVVDDGASDTTATDLQTYSKQQLPFRLLVVRHETPRGANPSRNHAIEKSSGDWIAMLDDDCVADSGWLEALVVARDRFAAVAVTGHVENIALSNQWERFFVGQHRVSSILTDGKPIARRLVAGNALVRRDWLVDHLDEDRAQVASDMGTSGRGDEEGLRLAILRSGESIIHAEDAIVLHDHPYQFRSFCRQAFKSGRSTARLAINYGLAPRWELICLLISVFLLPFAFVWPMISVIVAGCFTLTVIAFIYNEIVLKGKTVGQTVLTLPALTTYGFLRTVGYATEWLTLYPGSSCVTLNLREGRPPPEESQVSRA